MGPWRWKQRPLAGIRLPMCGRQPLAANHSSPFGTFALIMSPRILTLAPIFSLLAVPLLVKQEKTAVKGQIVGPTAELQQSLPKNDAPRATICAGGGCGSHPWNDDLRGTCSAGRGQCLQKGCSILHLKILRKPRQADVLSVGKVMWST